MTPVHFTPADPRSLDDLQLFLARAARIEEGSVRLIAGGGVLAVYVAVLYPQGLGDGTPTVLGLRVLRIEEPDTFDAVVPLASLQARIERAIAERTPGQAGSRVTMPPQVPSVIWAAITPSRGGWRPHPAVDAGLLEAAAHAGIAEVATAVPSASGESIVRRIRAEVWGRPIGGAEFLPAGAAFAALGLGFLARSRDDAPAEAIDCFETASWLRLSSPRGHVLVKRTSWSLTR